MADFPTSTQRRKDPKQRMAINARWIDRGPENQQHGNKPHFTRVSLPFSAGNTAATGGNMLLVFVFFLLPFSWVPGKVMENRGNREIFNHRELKDHKALTDQGKCSQPRTRERREKSRW
jgi:hypothetical protein